MVKATPKTRGKQPRKQPLSEEKQKAYHHLLLKLAPFSSSPSNEPQQPLETQPISASFSSPSPSPSPSKLTKANPRLRVKQHLNKPRSQEKHRAYRRLLLKQASFSTPPSHGQQQPPAEQQKSAAFSSPLPSKSMKRSSSLCSSPSSPYCSSQSHSLCHSSSSSFLGSTSPEFSSRPPRPPSSSPNLLRRAVSDPVPFLPYPSAHEIVAPKASSIVPESKTPSQPSSSSNLLRRTISEPIALLSSNSKEEKEDEKMKGDAVEAEKMSEDWMMVKFNCQCSKVNRYLVNAADKKCFKLV